MDEEALYHLGAYGEPGVHGQSAMRRPEKACVFRSCETNVVISVPFSVFSFNIAILKIDLKFIFVLKCFTSD